MVDDAKRLTAQKLRNPWRIAIEERRGGTPPVLLALANLYLAASPGLRSLHGLNFGD